MAQVGLDGLIPNTATQAGNVQHFPECVVAAGGEDLGQLRKHWWGMIQLGPQAAQSSDMNHDSFIRIAKSPRKWSSLLWSSGPRDLQCSLHSEHHSAESFLTL